VGLHTEISERSRAASSQASVAKSESSEDSAKATQRGTGAMSAAAARFSHESSCVSSFTLPGVSARSSVGIHESDQ
jgi:hypothetical protein